MSLKSLVLAAALAAPAFAWAPGAHADLPGAAPPPQLTRLSGMLWQGSVALPPCARPALRRLVLLRLAPTVPTATQERRGELVGEFRAPPILIDGAVRTAQLCATQAAAGAPALLLDSANTWPAFRQAFDACMGAQHAETYLGGMTLSVASRCNW